MRLPGRLAVLSLLAALAAAGAGAAEIAVLKSTDAPAWRPTIEAIKRAAPTHSFTEFDLRGDRAEADRVIGALKGRAALVVAMGPLAAQALKEGAAEMPSVYCMVPDPAKLGLTGFGVTFGIPVKNQLAAFRMVNPRGVRIGVIYNEANVGNLVREAMKASTVVRLVVVEKAVASDKDVPPALRSILKGEEAVDALWLPPDPVLLGESLPFIMSETLKAGKPVYTSLSALVAQGALVSDGPDYGSMGEQAAELVSRILAGDKKPEVVLPRAELVINKKIADKLKIEVPPDALKAANKVF